MIVGNMLSFSFNNKLGAVVVIFAGFNAYLKKMADIKHVQNNLVIRYFQGFENFIKFVYYAYKEIRT